MSNPGKLNAADTVMHRELAEIWRDVDADPDAPPYTADQIRKERETYGRQL